MEDFACISGVFFGEQVLNGPVVSCSCHVGLVKFRKPGVSKNLN